MAEQSIQNMRLNYIADMTCAIAHGIFGFGGKRLNIEPFTTILKSLDAPKQEEMTGAQVLDHILSEVDALARHESDVADGNAGP